MSEHNVLDLDPFMAAANEAYYLSGFNKRTYAELELPPVHDIVTKEANLDVVSSYQTFGNPAEAKYLVYIGSQQTTYLRDHSQQVRLAAIKEVLGDDYCVIGFQVYAPESDRRLSAVQQYVVGNGSLGPLAKRLDNIVNVTRSQTKEDQQTILYGFSSAADIVAEYAHLNLRDRHFGTGKIDRLGVFEAGRVHPPRLFGSIPTFLAFTGSGKDLYQNILDSDSYALLEAGGINPNKHRAEKKFMHSIIGGLAAYVAFDAAGNISLLKSYNHANTVSDINDITTFKDSADGPLILAGAAKYSKFSGPAFLEQLIPGDSLSVAMIEGDHSIADNIRKSAAFVLATATHQPAARV